MMETLETQSRAKSILFWVGLASCVYEAVINSLVTSGVYIHPVFPAIGVALATALIYCNGNNPSLKRY